MSLTALVHAESAIQSLAFRLLHERAKDFVFEPLKADGNDTYEIEARGRQIVVRGNTPAVQASALMQYLKQCCKCDVSWTGQQVALPAQLPKPDGKVRKVSPFKYRYYLNFCTFNYTMSFWDWPRWERELDWMALNGINQCLAAQIGQEAVWQRVMKKLGQSDEEVRKFLPGPAFGAWWMMGNHEGWGGPDPQWWIDRQAKLQKKILDRMRQLGIQPVLAAFYGNVPTTLKNHYPNSKFVSTGKWVGFQRPDMIVPQDPLFSKVAKLYYAEETKLFGTAKFYAGDPFHEGSVAAVDLKLTGSAIQQAMQIASPDSSWVLQAWGNNPHEEMLAGTDPSHTLILDLRGEGGGTWQARKGFGGRPWLLCFIGGFGGKSHFSGWMPETAEGTYRALGTPGMSGIGAVMEGSDENPAPYQLLYDLTWRDKAPNVKDWCADYAQRRYGAADANAEEAWSFFADSVYALPKSMAPDGEAESVLCARPALQVGSASSWGTTRRGYPFVDLYKGWQKLLQATSLAHSDAYQYDLVDVTRQVLSDWGQIQHQRMSEAFTRKDPQAFDAESRAFLGVIADMDRLLGTRREFLLGTWIDRAKKPGTTEEDKDWLEWNARTQLTTWGPGGEAADLRDYANKEWSGLLSSFYAKRWSTWIANRKQDLAGSPTPREDWIVWELAWNKTHTVFPTEPAGDAIQEARRIYVDYGARIERYLAAGNPIFQNN